MRVLLTGATGFAGSWLAQTLLAQGGLEVFGLSRSGSWPVGLDANLHAVRLLPCDLNDRVAVEALLRQIEPQQIYHLAGYAEVGRSFHDADSAWRGNLEATRSLYEAVARWGGKPRILAVGSGLIYGDPVAAGPLAEEAVLRPTSPYSASKAAADLVGYQFFRSHGLEIIRARPFNHVGPRQSPQFAVSSFARQLAEVVRGLRPPTLETGDLGASRDLSDVRDVVAAYVLLMEQGEAGEAYNVGSGVGRSMREVLDRLVQLAGVVVQVRQRADLVRRGDTPTLVADISRLRRATDWQPRFTLDQPLLDVLDYWKARV